MHKPISLKDIGLSFKQTSCFENFTTQIDYGNHIAIIGKNGVGKSSLLNIIRDNLEPTEGQVQIPNDVRIAYVEQTINKHESLSGGQRLNKRLTEVLALNPNILLLDEPTNHLDKDNRKSLIRMLQKFQGTLIIVSHDMKLLNQCINVLWHIADGKVHAFAGSYDNYMHERTAQQNIIVKELSSLKRSEQSMHTQLMKEQKRSASSKAKGKKSIKNKKWPTAVSNTKADRAGTTAGKRKAFINKRKSHLSKQLSELRLPELIRLKFSLNADQIESGNIMCITNASIAYVDSDLILKDINLSLSAKERIAIIGKNGSGKSTLLKAILGCNNVIKKGEWHVPGIKNIGYLDQHYSNLISGVSVLGHMKKIKPEWSEIQARKHLNNFLFRKNDEVFCLVEMLSGGEKARLSLCLIAANTPKLLILDEMTNNLDLETKEYVTQTLKTYPGAMILVSHDEEFLTKIGVNDYYNIAGLNG